MWMLQVNYILGSTGRSFVVGYGVNPPTHCHHRGASCYGPNRFSQQVLICSKKPLSANSLCQFLSPPIPAKSKIAVSAVAIQIVPTQTLTCSLELWLVGQERQMTSNQSYSRMHSSSIRNTQKILIFAHHYSVVYIYERNSSFLC